MHYVSKLFITLSLCPRNRIWCLIWSWLTMLFIISIMEGMKLLSIFSYILPLFTALQCPPTMSYDECGPPCLPTCEDPDGQRCTGPTACVAGCLCFAGQVFHNGACISRSLCWWIDSWSRGVLEWLFFLIGGAQTEWIANFGVVLIHGRPSV